MTIKVLNISNFSRWVGHYSNMTKPTISFLIMISALPTMINALEGLPSVYLLFWTCLGIFFMSGSASVFNQVIEHKTDSTMQRTKKRALPSKMISLSSACVFGLVMLVMGFSMLYYKINFSVAMISLLAHLLYVVFYTIILKKNTTQNIVIGGIAGALGPFMGAAAVSGQINSYLPWLLFVWIFLWTPPHFWSLSLKYQKDYASAGIPMYPVVYGESKTRKIIFLYSLSLIPVSFLLYFSGLFYSTVVCLLLSVYFAYLSWKLFDSKSNKFAMKLFVYSCVYIFCVFILISLEKIIFYIY